MTTKQIKLALATIDNSITLTSRKIEDGRIEYTARDQFFYAHGRSSEGFAQTVRGAIPAATVTGCGRVDKPFRGGGSASQNSHFWVKFTVPATDAK